MLKRFGLEPTNAKAVKKGDRFGRLTVRAVGQISGTYLYFAVCKCDCGSPLKRIRTDGLLSGSVVGCGCVRLQALTTHGLASSPHYDRWKNIMDRCYNPDCAAYPDYGGRGIKVCDDWHDLATFVRELPKGYKPGLEIDRIDNDGGYKPGNVRWTTRRVNTGNRRSARLIEYQGKTQSLSEWAAEFGLNKTTLSYRLDHFGWSVERSLTVPALDEFQRMAQAHKKRWAGHQKKPSPPARVLKTVDYQGRQVTIAELSKLTNISTILLRKRIFERGWSVEKATKE